MTMGNVPVAIGFAIITVSQLVVGIWLIAVTVGKGGKPRLLHQYHSRSRCLSTSLQLRPCSHTSPIDTPRRLQVVRVCSTQRPGGHVYEPLPRLWCVRIILCLGWMVLTQRKSDFLAFTMVVFLVTRLKARGIKIQSLMETIAADAVLYFMVIFTSHFVLAMTLYFARVSAITSLSGWWPMGAVAGNNKTSSSSVSR